MKKYIFIISSALFALLICFYVFFPNDLNKKRELITELTPLECDLNKSSCAVDYKGKKIEFNFSPKPLRILEETKITIKGLSDIKNLNARLYGLNMYMGDIVGEFDKIGDDYEGVLVFSSCIESTMRYRFELFSGDESLGIFIDFDVEK